MGHILGFPKRAFQILGSYLGFPQKHFQILGSYLGFPPRNCLKSLGRFRASQETDWISWVIFRASPETDSNPWSYLGFPQKLIQILGVIFRVSQETVSNPWDSLLWMRGKLRTWAPHLIWNGIIRIIHFGVKLFLLLLVAPTRGGRNHSKRERERERERKKEGDRVGAERQSASSSR